MWLAYELRDEALVSYPSVSPDYLGMTTYWAGEVDRYLLVGPGSSIDAPSSAFVASNRRFSLVDVQGAPVGAVIPNDLPRWSPSAQTDGQMIGPDGGTMTVLRSPGATGAVRLELGLTSNDGAREIAVTVVETGETVHSVIRAGIGSVVVDLRDLDRATVKVDRGADGKDSADRFVMKGVVRERR